MKFYFGWLSIETVICAVCSYLVYLSLKIPEKINGALVRNLFFVFLTRYFNACIIPGLWSVLYQQRRPILYPPTRSEWICTTIRPIIRQATYTNVIHRLKIRVKLILNPHKCTYTFILIYGVNNRSTVWNLCDFSPPNKIKRNYPDLFVFTHAKVLGKFFRYAFLNVFGRIPES